MRTAGIVKERFGALPARFAWLPGTVAVILSGEPAALTGISASAAAAAAVPITIAVAVKSATASAPAASPGPAATASA